jgi:hypothetical protein
VPFARVLVFALALTHAVGLADLVLDDACADVCSDDDCGDCTPGEVCRCHCPSTVPMIGTYMQTVSRIEPPHALTACAFEEQCHANPDPREILHVPRQLV